MRIVKHNIHKANASCNFCNRGELNGADGLSYPYSEVYSFQRDNGDGLLAFACEDCLKELSTALPPPASITNEAEALYPTWPFGKDSKEKFKNEELQAAHIAAARMYLSRLAEMGELLMTKDGEIEGLKNDVVGLKQNLEAAKLALSQIFGGTSFPQSIAQNALRKLEKHNL